MSLVCALTLCLSATAYASENNSILDAIKGFVADSMENRDAFRGSGCGFDSAAQPEIPGAVRPCNSKEEKTIW